MKGGKKRVLWALLCLLGVFCTGCLLVLMGVLIEMHLPDRVQKADCIVVAGSKVSGETLSGNLRARVNRAFELYQQGYSRAIIVCGGLGEEATITEARAMAGYLQQLGVPESDIYLEERSHTTVQNMENAKRIMDENGWQSAIITTSDFHAGRALACAKRAGIKQATCARARYDWGGKWIYVLREVPGWGKFFLTNMGLIDG